MSKTRWQVLIRVLTVTLLLVESPHAQATPLLPNTPAPGISVGNLGFLGPGTVLATSRTFFTLSGRQGSAGQAVYRENTGALDFLYQFDAPIFLTTYTVTLSGYAGFPTDVVVAGSNNVDTHILGVFLDAGSAQSDVTGATRTGGLGGDAVVGFNLRNSVLNSPGPGAYITTRVLVIRTNAADFDSDGSASVVGVVTVGGFRPAPADNPEPSSLVLGIVGSIFGVFFSRIRVR